MPDLTTARSPFPPRAQQEGQEQEAETTHNACALDRLDAAIRAKPEDLDRIAMIRAAIWIVAADGFGQGVTKQEAGALSDTTQAPAASRRIIKRLDKLMDPPQADQMITVSHWVIKDHMPKAD